MPFNLAGFDFAAVGAGLIVFIVFIALMVILAFVPIGLWISALAAGVKVAHKHGQHMLQSQGNGLAKGHFAVQLKSGIR